MPNGELRNRNVSLRKQKRRSGLTRLNSNSRSLCVLYIVYCFPHNIYCQWYKQFAFWIIYSQQYFGDLCEYNALTGCRTHKLETYFLLFSTVRCDQASQDGYQYKLLWRNETKRWIGHPFSLCWDKESTLSLPCFGRQLHQGTCVIGYAPI